MTWVCNKSRGLNQKLSLTQATKTFFFSPASFLFPFLFPFLGLCAVRLDAWSLFISQAFKIIPLRTEP